MENETNSNSVITSEKNSGKRNNNNKRKNNGILQAVIILLAVAAVFIAGYTVRGYADFFSGKNTSSADGKDAAGENTSPADGKDAAGESTSPADGKDAAEKEYIPGKNIGSFSALTFAEGVFSDEDLADCSVNIINIWATFCSPCIREMPDLEEISNEYAGKVRVIGICADTSDAEGNADLELFELGQSIVLEDLLLTYTNLVPDEKLQKGVLSDIYAYPTTFVTDAEGNILETIVGRQDKEGFLGYINRYLSE